MVRLLAHLSLKDNSQPATLASLTHTLNGPAWNLVIPIIVIHSPSTGAGQMLARLLKRVPAMEMIEALLDQPVATLHSTHEIAPGTHQCAVTWHASQLSKLITHLETHLGIELDHRVRIQHCDLPTYLFEQLPSEVHVLGSKFLSTDTGFRRQLKVLRLDVDTNAGQMAA